MTLKVLEAFSVNVFSYCFVDNLRVAVVNETFGRRCYSDRELAIKIDTSSNQSLNRNLFVLLLYCFERNDSAF